MARKKNRGQSKRARARGISNVLDNKLTVKVQSPTAIVTSTLLQLLQRPCKVISISWTATSVEPNTMQVQLVAPNGESAVVSRMILIHKNISRGILRAPRGMDLGVYTASDTVFTIASGTATTTTPFYVQVTVRVKYTEPVGTGAVFQSEPDTQEGHLSENEEEDPNNNEEVEDPNDEDYDEDYDDDGWGLSFFNKRSR